MRAYERLLKYVVVRTPSDHTSTTVPTTSCQFGLAHLLVTELKELGLTDASVDEKVLLYTLLFLQQKDMKRRQSLDLSHTWTRYQTSATMTSPRS